MACIISAATVGATASAPIHRSVPEPLPEHPGNVFLAGEAVTVALPPGASRFWHAFDYGGNVVAEGRADDRRADLGELPVGYYEVRRVREGGGPTERVTLAVLAPLQRPVPLTSPIAVDAAMSWFYPREQMPQAASLCALAGVNWVRDRLSWPDMEPDRGRIATDTRYDEAARVQANAGLQVLQVNHLSPAWANPNPKRFPLDLRDIFTFYRAMARWWRGRVRAFEPWNEADIPMFGGHTGSQIATLQKAAYLGLKAGNPDLIVCQNVFALHRRAILDDFRDNRAWAYFDTFNLHHYVPLDQFPMVYADFRAVSAGRPLWVTECSIPVPWSGSPKLKEPSDADLRVQAERVAKIYAAALYEGAREIFYFLLPHYAEGKTQFGLLHPGLTPRPAYVALAATGRLLANAHPLGRLHSTNRFIRGFLFRDGATADEHELLVAWTTGPQAILPLPTTPLAVFDLLGRQKSPGGAELDLGGGPVFACLTPGSGRRMPMTPPPQAVKWLPGAPATVVLQAVWPAERTVLRLSAYRVSVRKVETVPLEVYNFGRQTARGKLKARSPRGWRVAVPETEIKLEPGQRLELPLTIQAPGIASTLPRRILVTGRFGWRDRPVLSFRVLAEGEGDSRRPAVGGR